MPLPINLVFVRHGQSEGNVLKKRVESGASLSLPPEFLDRHSSTYRLSDKGKQQAVSAGEWLRGNDLGHFDRYYTSEYVRAMETAGLLALPDARWYKDFYLRERDYGQLDVPSEQLRTSKYPDYLAQRERDGLFWTPPGGESIATTRLRVDRFLATLGRECGDKNVIAVCHGEFMWACRISIERMTRERFDELDKSRDPKDRIGNCQVLHYTRRDPETGRMSGHIGWMRSVCPWDLGRSSNEWTPIVRKAYSSAELLEEAETKVRTIA